MKPLIVLLVSFGIAIVAIQFIKKESDILLAARIGMAVMLVFTSIGHFAFTDGMSMMIPKVIPFKVPIVYFTGVLEVLLAIGLLTSQFKVVSAWILILFLVLMLPANIYAAFHNVNYQSATLDGNGLIYLWFRIPLQILFIAWIYMSAIRVEGLQGLMKI